jgi:hypothetical protein
MEFYSATNSHPPLDDQGLPIVNVLGMPIAQLPLPGLLEYYRVAVRGLDRERRTRLNAYANAHTRNLIVENEEYHRAILRVDLI